MSTLTITEKDSNNNNNSRQIISITADKVTAIPRYQEVLFSCTNVTHVTGSLTRKYPRSQYTAHTAAGVIPSSGHWIVIRDYPATRLCPEVKRSIQVLLSNKTTRPTLT